MYLDPQPVFEARRLFKARLLFEDLRYVIEDKDAFKLQFERAMVLSDRLLSCGFDATLVYCT